MASVTFDSARPDLTLPSANTAKLTWGAPPLMVTAGTPADCSAENGAAELREASLAPIAAAESRAWRTDTGLVGGGVGPCPSPPPEPPPQPARATAMAAIAAAAPNLSNLSSIYDSVTSDDVLSFL